MSSLSSSSTSPDREILLEQYKLAVEMAARLSIKRQDANNFYIGLVSIFGVLYSLLDKLPSSLTQTIWRDVLPILAVAWCFVWWFAILSYRRINKAKWNAIYELERDLPAQPFLSEKEYLSGDKKLDKDKVESPGSFALSKLELLMPILVGIIFLLLAALSQRTTTSK
jgi:hypothetical protein